ncbi:MAG: hypothetical protein ACE5KX_07225 [Acidimicrobiia bacterium]
MAVDVDWAMVEAASRFLGDRAGAVRSDLTSLLLVSAMDVMFSTAIFHWIPYAQPPSLTDVFRGWGRPFCFPWPEQTEAALGRAGFADIHCWLAKRPVVLDRALEYLEAITLGPRLERLDEAPLRAFVVEVASRLPQPIAVDYPRLNIEAGKPEDRP